MHKQLSHKQNWDDLRYVLAVADTGTISAAARLLGVNHATVLRRIASFEAQHGGQVFERRSHGYALLEEKRAVLDAAREVQEAVLSVERLMQGSDEALTGIVRLSSTDTFCQAVLPAFVSEVNTTGNALSVELMCSNDHIDFARLEADIALRPALSLPSMLTGEVVAELGFAVYARAGAPKAWLGLGGPLLRSAAAQWLRDSYPDVVPVATADSFVVLRELALLGLGQVLLPCFIGDAAVGLERRSEPLKNARVPIWVLTHRDLRQTPRMRAVQKRLGSFMLRQRDRLAGG